MNIDSAKELKFELFSKLYAGHIHNGDVGLRSEALSVREDFSEQMAVGYSRKARTGDYCVELRLMRPNGRGAQIAEEVQAKAPNEIRVATVESLSVPSPERLRQSTARNKGSAVLGNSSRPLHLGLSIGHVDGGTGSIGAFVYANRACNRFPNGGIAVLSCCHVLALQPNGKFITNIAIYQPGRQDKEGSLLGGDVIAEMQDHYTTFSRVGSNYVDAAYAMIEPGKVQDLLPDAPNHVPAHLGGPCSGPLKSKPMPYDELQFRHKIAKVGRTTGFTTGNVSGFGVDDITINVNGVGNVRFDNLLEIEWETPNKPFAADGDSGSLVFDLESRRPIGMHFAGGRLLRDGQKVGVSYAFNLEYTLKMFDLRLL